MDFDSLLKTMLEKDASDLYLSANAKPTIRIHGDLTALDETGIDAATIETIANTIMDEKQRQEFAETLEMNLAISRDNGRFRVNIFRQRDAISIVIRNIKTSIPSSEALGLPEILRKIIMIKRGLVIVVGATGSGKSTTLASLIDYRNIERSDHIITIEDPIEYIYTHKKSIVNQREVGVDTLTYGEALKNTLRQAPDVIMIGEIRAEETMDHAIAFAETGHLCLSTLHANNANQALDRILNFFPQTRKAQVRLDLSLNLRAIVSQRLVPNLQGERTLALEIMLNSPLIADLIKKGEIDKIKEVMERSEEQGMQTFDCALYNLCKSGVISEEEALRNSDSPNNLKLRLSLNEDTTKDQQKFSIQAKADEEEGDEFMNWMNQNGQ